MSRARPWSFHSSGRVIRSIASALAIAATGGCASRGNVEMLEADLRRHQDQVATYERQVTSLRDELVSARAETDQLRRELVALGKEGRQEATEPLARVAGIQFNSLMTGGRDSDGEPGHDVITAVLAPHDKDGDLVKLGGELQIEVIDLTRPADSQRLGTWKYSVDQTRELWHSGFLASGFQLDLPVGTVPKTGEVILHGRLVTADGRQFDTSCPVSLVSAESAVAAPRSLPAPRQSRPVSRSSRPGGSAPEKASVIMASAEVSEPRAKKRVEPAAVVSLEEEPAPLAPSAQSRPVPDPVDLPASQSLPVVRPGVTPRPFPGARLPAETSAPRPFPKDLTSSGRVQTSDNWTDETIPALR